MTEWVTMGLLSVVLIAAAITDCRTHLVPKWLTYPAILAGLVWSTVAGAIDPQIGSAVAGLQNSAMALGLAILAFGALYAAGGLGGGDVKLMAAVGAIGASWQVLLATAFYAFIIGAIIAVFLMVARGLFKQTVSRIWGAALMAGARTKAEFPDDSPRVPFALAVCIGGLLGTAEVLLGLPTPWAPSW